MDEQAVPLEENTDDVKIALDAKTILRRFYRITFGTLCFGALVGAGIVESVAPVAGRWRGSSEKQFLAHWRGRGAKIERLDGQGQVIP